MPGVGPAHPSDVLRPEKNANIKNTKNAEYIGPHGDGKYFKSSPSPNINTIVSISNIYTLYIYPQYSH